VVDGELLAEHWDGQSWTAVPVPPPPRGGGVLHDVSAIASDDVWATGSRNFDIVPLIEHWDGTAWSIVRLPNLDHFTAAGVSGVTASDVWTVGGWRNLSLHYDGSAWSPYPVTGPRLGYLNDVAAVAADDVWAVGRIVDPRGDQPLIEHSTGVCP
jgi:hypothetical protein